METTSRPNAGNVPENWTAQSVWGTWGKPYKILRGAERYQQGFIDVVGPKRPGGYRQPVRLTLERDSENEHDRNAIKVWLDLEHIGFIAKEIAKKLAPEMDARGIEVYEVPGIVVGGSTNDQRSTFGCWIWPRRCFNGGIKISDVVQLGEDYKPWGSTWNDYLTWEDDDSPPGVTRGRAANTETSSDIRISATEEALVNAALITSAIIVAAIILYGMAFR